MALIWLDSCDDLSWLTGSTTTVSGRNGNGTRTGSASTVIIPAPYEADCVTVGAAVRYPNTIGSSNDLFLLKSDAGVTSHLNLQTNANGSLRILRSATILGTSAAGVIQTGRWHYVEFAARLHDTLGTLTVRVDGVTVIGPLSSQDTKNAGTKTVFDAVAFGNSLDTQTFDDIYLCTATTTPDAFLGDILVDQLLPDGNGNASQWLGSDGDSVNNYLLVNETGAPVVSTYVGSSTVGQQDMYTLANVTRTGVPIKAVCHCAYATKTDSVNAFSAKLVNRRAVDTKSVTFPLSITYTNYGYGLTTDPETGAAWTETNVNALQSGIEIV